ncbi:MAG: hypothetical protein AAFY71_07645 [Bacteroidota bacterium]
MKHVLPLIFIVSILGFSCRPTKRAFEKGDYEVAIRNSVDRLRSSPNNKKSRETLAKAYPAFKDYMEEQVVNAKMNGDMFKWEAITPIYRLMNSVYDEIRKSPAAMEVIPNPTNYRRELAEANRNAAEARYAMGSNLMSQARNGNKERAREAYDHFIRATDFVPQYKNTRNLIEEARNLGTIFVKMDPIPMHSRALSLTSEFFENQILEYVANTTLSPFVRFYSAKDTYQPPYGPDHVVQMVFDDFVVGQAYVKETVRDRLQDSVVVDEVRVNDSTVKDVYGTVRAEVTSFRKEISSTGLLDFRIIDARNGSLITQKKFPGTFIWIDQWGWYTGDERALRPEDREACAKRRESPNPPPQTLFIEFTKPIFNQVTGFTRNFYSGV